jgi:hypothetical protein
MLVQVTARHFCAGLVLENDVVVEAAPILKKCLGKRRPWLRSYFAEQGWKTEVVKEDRRSSLIR